MFFRVCFLISLHAILLKFVLLDLKYRFTFADCFIVEGG